MKQENKQEEKRAADDNTMNTGIVLYVQSEMQH